MNLFQVSLIYTLILLAYYSFLSATYDNLPAGGRYITDDTGCHRMLELLVNQSANIDPAQSTGGHIYRVCRDIYIYIITIAPYKFKIQQLITGKISSYCRETLIFYLVQCDQSRVS